MQMPQSSGFLGCLRLDPKDPRSTGSVLHGLARIADKIQ
jgi:hypothetical protein